MKYLVTNGTSKGIIIEAIDADQARKKAKFEFYSPWPPKNDLNQVQAYDPGKHTFVSVNGNKFFKYVQYHTLGGVVTNYDCTIDTPPSQDQIKFLDRPIEYIKFFNDKKEQF